MNEHRWQKAATWLFLMAAMVLSGCTSMIASPSKTTAPTVATVQRLRLVNQSSFDLKNLLVIFPDERVEFGDVPAGTTTGYLYFPKGVYRYAAYNVEIEGKRYEQPVVDWIGEKPMDGTSFTYVLNVDPSQWEVNGQVIQLTQVNTDSTK